MPTLVLDPQPPEIDELLERRRAIGADRWDEVWEGVLHMIPPPSVEHERLAAQLVRLLGPYADTAGLTVVGTIGIGADKDDYRVPDLAFLRPGYEPQWNATAALVVEVVSPGDDSWDKVPFYAAHHVEELLIVEPRARQVHWLALDAGEYKPVERSELIELGPLELAGLLDWPQ